MINLFKCFDFQISQSQNFLQEGTMIALVLPLTSQNKTKSSHQRCSVEKVFLEILQNSQENTSARVTS